MASLPVTPLTLARYLELDNSSRSPSEFFDGEMFEIEAATESHGLIQVNVTIAAGTRIRKSACAAMGQSTRVRVPSGKYFHPDLVVVCGKREFHPDQTLINPTVIFEILSNSTADFDLGTKGILYRSIPSLKEYIVIGQKRARAVRWTRQAAPETWQVEGFTGLDKVLPIKAIGCEIPLSELYFEVEFDPES